MGFFFSRAKAEPKPEPSGPRNKISTKLRQSAPMLNRLGCAACPLNKTGNIVEASIPKKPTAVYFLGEAPGANEEKEGRPFIGKSGRLLRGEIPDEYANKCAFGNAVRHRPPDNRTPDWVEVEACRGYATADIEKARPKVIVGLGMVALQWMMGSSDLKGQRGRLFAVQVGNHKCYFLPTYHPSFILRTAYDPDKPLQSKMGHAFRLDIAKAFRSLEVYREPLIVTPAEAKADIDTIFPGSFLGFDNLIQYFHRARDSGEIAIDLETFKLRPYSEGAVLLSASISFFEKGRQENHLRTFAFPVNHPKAQWTKSQLATLKDAWLELLADKKVFKIAHNTPFEIEWLIEELGNDVIDHDSWGDTMMQAHVLDERKGESREDDRRPTYQSLDFLCKMYFGLKIKSLFKMDKKDMRKNTLDDLLLYNGCDSKYTLLLHNLQDRMLELEGLGEVYDISRPRQTTVAIMQRLGIDVDQDVAKQLAADLQKQIEEIEADISRMKVIKQYNKDKKEPFNPHSQHNVLEVFKDYLGANVKVPKKHSKNEFRLAVDKAVLGGIEHPLAPAIIRLRNRQKLKSTYIDEFILGTGTVIYPDGKLHTSFNTTFTTSARLSSDDPNLQNFPKHQDKWVRKQVKPKKGYILISVDYSQLEWCTACIECKDKVMVDATWTGYDVHMVWAEKIADRWPELIGGKKHRHDPAVMKVARSRVKNKAVFPLIFGAQDSSVAGYLNMPDDVAKDIFTEFWETFDGLGRWQKQLMKNYYDLGYVENKIGRRRRYPMTKNEAINYPIQSLGAEIVVDAMNRLSQIAVESGEWYLHPRLNIHDDLTMVVPDNEAIIDESIKFFVEEMLLLPYDFINVPMGCEISIGYDWCDMEEVGKFTTIDIGRHKSRK